MATKFLEPGGDVTFNTSITSTGGFWGGTNAAPAVATDFVHGNHVKSIKFRPNNLDLLWTPDGVLADAGSRASIYIYLNVLPTATSHLFSFDTTGAGREVVIVQITSGGVLQLTDELNAQIGTNGSTLSTGIWYRLCLADTISSTTVNEFRLFKNGVIDISVSNATLTRTATSSFLIGNQSANVNLDYRMSDLYIDNSAALTDTNDIWVTAKRPNANGTTNGFTTQIGAGGSGYGSGHSPQVNERALSNTNGWSMIGAGSAVTEEYNIEGQTTGDINISGSTIIDYIGWVDAKAALSETGSIIVNNVTNNISLTSAETIFTQVAGSATYPAGTGTDIGIITSTAVTTVSLYECGIMIAYIPASGAVAPPFTNANLKALLIMGVGK